MKKNDEMDLNPQVVPTQESENSGGRPGEDVPEAGRGEEDDEGVKNGRPKVGRNSTDTSSAEVVYNINIYVN